MAAGCVRSKWHLLILSFIKNSLWIFSPVALDFSRIKLWIITCFDFRLFPLLTSLLPGKVVLPEVSVSANLVVVYVHLAQAKGVYPVQKPEKKFPSYTVVGEAVLWVSVLKSSKNKKTGLDKTSSETSPVKTASRRYLLCGKIVILSFPREAPSFRSGHMRKPGYNRHSEDQDA